MSRKLPSAGRALETARRRIESLGITNIRFAQSELDAFETGQQFDAIIGRMVLLSKLEETLVIGSRRADLSANRYPGAIHPQGYLYLREFRQDPCPTFVYEVDGVVLEKSIFMVHGENTTVIQYRLLQSPAVSCSLEIRPLIAFRDYHSITHENGALDRVFGIGESPRARVCRGERSQNRQA